MQVFSMQLRCILIYSWNVFILCKDIGQLTVRKSNKSAQTVVVIIRNCVSILGKRCCC